MTVIIRNAAPGDEVAILAFIKELAAYEKLAHEVVATEMILRKSLFGDAPKVLR